ncbi:ABC transporter permease subunit [Xylophilus rhododendri]|uniref:ABC transporter permease subunit n=1 Tax=Xylophilus rhododendri TaxID=2697032 RepID=A0A857J6P7_9BURK|nr:ABC transporter permease [Xylophilus rhododendri]QHI99680.1 ABC transporter permease subunit [Xylophilus rhododendri]
MSSASTASAGRRWVLGTASLIVFLALWEVLVRALHVKPILLPPPTAVIAELAGEWAWYLDHAAYTLMTTLAGFVLAAVLGVLLATLLVSSAWFEHTVYPLIVGLNSVPKVAVAPIFVIWMGTGSQPKIAIAFLVAVFAVIVDTMHGLRSVSTDVMDLGRVLKGSPLQFFFKVRLPGALPSILAGFKVAISLSLVGAIVGEFVASQKGLGYVILSAQGTFDTTRVFAAVLMLAAMGLLLYGAVALAEKKLMPWR